MAVIWIHALVAMLFCGVVVVQARAPTRMVPRWLLAAALSATALWALAVAGIDGGDVSARVAGSVRNVAWLAVLAALTRGDGLRTRWRTGAYVATAACMLLSAGVGVAQVLAESRQSLAALADGALTLAMLSTAAALVLAYRAAHGAGRRGFAGRHLLVAALALMWSTELLVHLLAWIAGDWPAALTLARGIAMVVAAPMIAIAVHRDGEWTLSASRTVALQGVLMLAAALYGVTTILATGFLGQVAGDYARVVQTAFVFGTAAALLTIASSPWLRAWAKVVVAKHLFSHRFDYRAEWMRFTDTLGTPGEGAAPLAERVVKATADLTDSPAGLLLIVTADGLTARAAWQWDDAPAAASDTVLIRQLETTRRILDLDAARTGRAPFDETAAIPAWLLAREGAWALVPLMHVGRLVGAIVLARPPVARALDWEDFDLLGVAGRQVASYLAEDAAHAALADARRFEEFNRRFAFIMHDLKNLVSQISLVARNAERHADNPEFRADMIATLRDSSQRMTTLLARLSHHHPAPTDATRAVAVRALAERMADARRAQHPIRATGDAAALARADPAALETVLGHLLQNAVEASAPGVPVTIDVAGDAADVTIAVIDRGAGMTPAFLRDDLFRPFVSSKPAGFGLGAFEARQLVEAMGGRLSADSREGEGARFRIVLPRAIELEQAA